MTLPSFLERLRDSTFRRQISLAVTVGVLLLALFTSLATSWHGSRQIERTLREQGERVADNLARQSRLALLYDSRENAAEVLAGTLAFPDVIRVEIRRGDGRALVVVDKADDNPAAAAETLPQFAGEAAFLEQETAGVWRFLAPVATGGADSPFAADPQKAETLGYVRVVVGKATLTRTMLSLFALNMAISFFFAFVFLAAIRWLTRRLTQPLAELSGAMGRAELGESGVRADPAGPRDIALMAQAFNSMMVVLEERERELRRAHDEAIRFARMKAEFAATMSHELRTPLNGVVGTLDLLRVAPLPPASRQYVELAWESAQYLLDLINNILDFSSLEAGKLVLQENDFDVSRLCEQAVELAASQVAQKRLEIGYVVAPEVPARLRGDSRRLRQILVNLVGNAVKFTDRGEVAIHVSLVEAAGGRGVYRFEVVDTGIGIAPEVKDRIFDSFVQADPSSTRRHGGSGLGLAICKQLVGLMGGEIGVDSTPAGSDFWFTVPLAAAGADGPLPLPAPHRGHGERVLLVEESAIVREFIEQSLGTCGYDCRTARSTDEARAALRSAASIGTPYRLVVMDTTIAAGHADWLHRLREDATLGLPLLVLMNRYGAEVPAEAPPADAYLAKPLRLERLLECMAAAMGEVPGDNAGARRSEAVRSDHRVLIVEDNRTSQTIAAGMLAMLGCRAELAGDGREAIQAFKRGRWDLILMDCNMPEMDGFEATAAIRALEGTSDRRVPIVAMTANTQPADVEKCLSAGMDDHLPKPLTLGSLGARLQRWLPQMDLARRPAIEPMPAAAPTPARNDGPLDAMVFAKLREILGGALAEAIRPFLEDMPAYLEAIEASVAAGEPEQLRHAAHAIKGAAGNLGALALAAAAKDIEDHAALGRSSHPVDALVSRLQAEYALVRQALTSELESENEAAPRVVADGALVLVVDDDRSTRSALRAALQGSGFRVEEASDGELALAAIERELPDVILLDALMPVMDGFATCARLQETPAWREIPVLMITALEDSQSIERAFAVGASDYIPKPIHLAVVNQRVRRLVEATRAQRHVRHLAYNDLLTGLPNRALFNDHFNRCLDRASASTQSVALLFLDLDRFKFVNDTLGHEVGDRLLKAAAERIRNCVRGSDCVARFGGDEFSVVIDELPNVAVAATAAQKICRAIAAPFDIDSHEICVSASVGIAVYPRDGTDASALLRRADTAMYRAKKKNTGFQFFEEGMEAAVSEHLRLEGALRRAIERDELLLYFQPIADTVDCRLIGMEALVRWAHPTRGIVSPLEFIPVAEETGLIIAIGEWVLRTACRQIKHWVDAGFAHLHVTVNLSGVQLQQGDFADVVRGALAEAALDPKHLTLEITESVLMENAEETLGTLASLKATGVGLAIDDFGTGYSSLAYLRRFPVDVLKIDRAFTRDMMTNSDDASIVSGIVALAHNLRLAVIAEGVETEEQRAALTAIGCDHIQGYLLSQPVPAEVFAARMLTLPSAGADRERVAEGGRMHQRD